MTMTPLVHLGRITNLYIIGLQGHGAHVEFSNILPVVIEGKNVPSCNPGLMVSTGKRQFLDPCI